MKISFPNYPAGIESVPNIIMSNMCSMRSNVYNIILGQERLVCIAMYRTLQGSEMPWYIGRDHSTVTYIRYAFLWLD